MRRTQPRPNIIWKKGKGSMAALKLVSSAKFFSGVQKVFEHSSEVLKCNMNFAIFLPTKSNSTKVPVLYWLSGLTCTEQTFTFKTGSQKYAEEHGIAVVIPDTSPRGCNIEGEEDSWDFGTGAGFYVDATEEKWKTNYNMYSYITRELPSLINSNFPVLMDKVGIFGHSMGGHGALICALKNPGKYKSVSAFAPISNPINCPWGEKAFSGYIGPDKEIWKDWDACELVKGYKGPPFSYILIDQGKDDKFLIQNQLLPENFVEACRESGTQVVLRMQEGYDHSYCFVSTFLEDHFKHHAACLN
jgi:S-formylglutathione hydrolase